MGKSDDSSTELSHERRKRRKRPSSKKRKEDRRKKRRRKDDYSNESSSNDTSSTDDSYYYERKRRKKDKKKRKKKHKKEKKRSKRRDETTTQPDPLERNYALADALVDLLEEHPALVEDLPLMLIRLASGTAFDLTQMTNASASQGLGRVFSCLTPFGVRQDAIGAWVWQSSSSDVGGSNRATSQNEFALIKLVRAMLNQLGLTMEALDEYENPKQKSVAPPVSETTIATSKEAKESKSGTLEKQTQGLLKQFYNSDLAKELVTLCNMILEGESISIEGLPEESLREALESIFVECGLEKSEMEEDDEESADEEDDSNAGPSFGFGLPEVDIDNAKSRLQAVLQTCSTAAAKPRVKGPMMRPAGYQESAEAESSDDEGPLPVGAGVRGPKVSEEVLKARAASRSRQLAMAKQGIDPSVADAMEGQAREEWMVVPGKFDFLSAVKAGQPMKSRGFEAKSKANDDANVARPMDPKIRAEIDAIRQAHEESRGPSLLEQHREKKAQEAMEAKGDKGSWKWSREKDLDSGRRVDKSALNMIYGGAGSDLKKKFQGGF